MISPATMRLHRFDYLWLIIFLSPLCQGVKDSRFHPELIKDLANVGSAIVQSEVDVALASAEGIKNVVNATAGLSVTSLSLLSNLTMELVDASIKLAEVIIEAKLNLAVPLAAAVQNLTSDALETKKVLLDKLVEIPADLAEDVLELKTELATQTAELVKSLGSKLIQEKVAAGEFLLSQSLSLLNKSVELADQLIQFKEGLAGSTLDYTAELVQYKLQKLGEVKDLTSDLALSSQKVLSQVYDSKLETLQRLSDLIGQVYNATKFYTREFVSAKVQVSWYVTNLVADIINAKLELAQAVADEGREAGEVIGAGVLHILEAKVEALSRIYNHFSQRLGALWCKTGLTDCSP